MFKKKSTATNIFLLLLAKEILKLETAYYFDTVEATAVLKYLDDSNPLDTRASTPDDIQIPSSLLNFKNNCWNRIENRIYDQKDLDILVRGIKILGRFKSWSDFEKKYSSIPEKIWAEKFTDGLYPSLSSNNLYDIERTVDGFFHRFYCREKIVNKYFSEEIYKIAGPIYSYRFSRLRLANADDLTKIGKNIEILGVGFEHSRERVSFYLNDGRSVYVYVDYLGNIFGSVVVKYLDACLEDIKTDYGTVGTYSWDSSHVMRHSFERQDYNAIELYDMNFVNEQVLIYMLTNIGALIWAHGGFVDRDIPVFVRTKRKYIHLLKNLGFQFPMGSNILVEFEQGLPICSIGNKDLLNLAYGSLSLEQPTLNVFTEEQMKKLISNGVTHGEDNVPVALLLQADLGYHWIVSEVEQDDQSKLWGLTDYPDHKPKIGYFDLNAILELSRTQYVVLNHPSFKATDKLSLYMRVANDLGYITTKEELHYEVFEKNRNK